MLIQTSATFAGSLALAQSSDGGFAEAKTASGIVRGAKGAGLVFFKGVPYAGSVSSPANRFKAAPPVKAWTGVRDAVGFGVPS